MKKVSVILASLVMMFAVCTTANAGGGLIVKAGVNYAGVDYKEVMNDISSFDYKDFAGYHAGIGFQTGSLLGFSVQPELLYQVNSASLDDTSKLEMNTAQLVLNAQWGIDLLVVKPFVFAAPFFAYNLSQAVKGEGAEQAEVTYQDVIQKAKDAKFDYGIGLGVGVELFQFIQITARYNWGFGEFKDWKELSENYKNASFETSEGTLCVSLALKF